MPALKNLLLISYAKRTLEPGSREVVRMQEYAAVIPGHLTIIVFTRQSDQLPQRYVHKNLTVIATHSKTRLGMVIRAYQIGRKVLKKQLSSDWLVSSQDPFESSLVARAIIGWRRVPHHVQIHGDQFNNPRWRRESILNPLRLWYGMRVLKKSCGIRVVSARAKRALITLGIEADTISVLPIDASLQPFLAVGATRQTKSVTSPTILYLGRLAPEKNLLRLVRVFKMVQAVVPEARLHIVGSGPQQSVIEKEITIANLNDSVTMTSWTNNVAGVLAAADVFVLCSLHEGYALVIAEAMAAGLPIVSTDVGCVGELMHDGKHGYVVPFDDDSQFVDRLTKLCQEVSLREQFGKNSYLTMQVAHSNQANYIEAWKATFCA